MDKPKVKRKLKDRLKDRYRLVILNENTLQDVWYAVLSRINLILWLGFISALLIATGILAITFSPLREYIPGYPDGNTRRMFVVNTLHVDSLEEQLRVRDQYINNIQKILKGNDTEPYIATLDSLPPIINDEPTQPTDFDNDLFNQIDEEQKYGISSQPIYRESETEINKLHFYKPLQGTITNIFNTRENHFGIDIVSNINEPVLSVLDGTVIMAAWTLEAGYIIQVQHRHNLVSVYKHNSMLLKKMGERVIAGDVIAMMGNTGEYTTGPHLHFELWHAGKPLNPRDYIVF